jgi:hypothetical protein
MGVTESSASCQIAQHRRRKRRERRGRDAVFVGAFGMFVSRVGQKQRSPARSAMIRRHVWHRAEKSVTPKIPDQLDAPFRVLYTSCNHQRLSLIPS